MSTRRGHGEGSIFQRESDGRWCATVDLGSLNGRRQRKAIYGKTRKEVAEKLKVALRDHQQGLPVVSERQTVAQFLAQWMETVVIPAATPRTVVTYQKLIRIHLVPALGSIQLTKLTAQDVQRMLVLKHKTLSAATVRLLRTILRSALQHAVIWNLLPRNVATLTSSPTVTRPTTPILTVDQAQQFLHAAQHSRFEAAYHVALTLGLRRGEVLGLRWQDINWQAQTLRVELALQEVSGQPLALAAPKTRSSRRTLPLPDGLAAVLRRHRQAQLAARLVAGTRWQDHDLIFSSRAGTLLRSDTLITEFKQILRTAGLPEMRFHDLRHSCASLLAAQGVPPKVAMTILGHTTIATTMNIYTHVIGTATEEAISGLDRVLGTDKTGSA